MLCASAERLTHAQRVYIYLVGPPETEVKPGNFAQGALIMWPGVCACVHRKVERPRRAEETEERSIGI